MDNDRYPLNEDEEMGTTSDERVKGAAEEDDEEFEDVDEIDDEEEDQES